MADSQKDSTKIEITDRGKEILPEPTRLSGHSVKDVVREALSGGVMGGPHCACNRVKYSSVPSTVGSARRDRWVCEDCGAEFVRQERLDRSEELRVSTATHLSNTQGDRMEVQRRLYALADLILDRDDPHRVILTALGIVVDMDGDQHCAKLSTFQNPMESPIGYGPSSMEAVVDMIKGMDLGHYVLAQIGITVFKDPPDSGTWVAGISNHPDGKDVVPMGNGDTPMDAVRALMAELVACADRDGWGNHP